MPFSWIPRSLLGFGLLLNAMLSLPFIGWSAEPKPFAPPRKGLSPKEELATFKVNKGFRIELVACEPNVIDPVAMAFDEDGRLFVVEMPGYPNGGVATGQSTSGKIKILEDKDGDGFYKTCTTFVDGLRFPTSAMPWKDGALVADAPHIYFMRDTKGTGKADERRVLYDGFNLVNVEQLINSLQWGLDNWVYGCAGNDGGTVTSTEKPDAPAITLRARGVRFHPDIPASLEPTSGGGQYGLAPDDWENWFTATNSQHLRQIILPDHYLRRNSSLAVNAVTLDIPDHGAACKVFRISPFEAWRIERTRRRGQGPDARRFPSTELVPGGFITSGCSPVVYAADLFPEDYRNNTFVCDPANNIVHRDVLVPKGCVFSAMRADSDHEFLASTDIWFRPVSLTVGPDGALYVADFYREGIETPLSLTPDLQKMVNLESQGKGRIWRIVPEGVTPTKRPKLRSASTTELVRQLDDSNITWRLTVQRLLVERQDMTAIAPLEKLVREAKHAAAKANALWSLEGLKALSEETLLAALADASDGVRAQALRLSDKRLASSESLRKAVTALAGDSAPQVRLQLAFTLGEASAPECVATLAKIARRDAGDRWIQTAVLSSAATTAPALLEALAHDRAFIDKASSAQLEMLTRLAALAGASSRDADLAGALQLIGSQRGQPAPWQLAILRGLGQGLQSGSRSLARLWKDPPPGLREAVGVVTTIFERAAVEVRDAKKPTSDRVASIRLLAFGPPEMALGILPDLLGPQNSSELQLAAIRALALVDSSKVAEVLLKSWGSYGPAARREVLEAMIGRSYRVKELLDAMERKQILAGQIEPARLDQLRKLRDSALRARSQKVLAGLATPDRAKVVAEYKSALDLKGDIARGKVAFKKTCATCHRLENEGIEVGPDLLSALRNKTPENLLIDILDPSREVDPRYINYLVTKKDGRVYTGLIAAETSTSITLRRAEKAEDTILRNQIDEIQATAKSLMPEGLEMQLSKQDLADVIAYLQIAGGGPKKEGVHP